MIAAAAAAASVMRVVLMIDSFVVGLPRTVTVLFDAHQIEKSVPSA
jgi:hypothetical protein